MREKGLRLPTVRGILRALSTVLSEAVEDELLPANPALKIGKYLQPGDEIPTEIQPLTRAEAEHLVAIAKQHFPRWHPWVLLALRTGLRWGNSSGSNGATSIGAAASWWCGGIVRGSKRRRSPIASAGCIFRGSSVVALKSRRRVQEARWLKKGKSLPVWVFSSLDGTALEERNIRHVFARMLTKAELHVIRVHDLRHTFASLLLQAGAPITYVKEQLGHSHASTTLKTYAHYMPDPTHRDVDRLDDDAPPLDASQAHPEDDASDLDVELSALNCVVSREGIEPSTRRLRVSGRPSTRFHVVRFLHISLDLRPVTSADSARVRALVCQIVCQPTR